MQVVKKPNVFMLGAPKCGTTSLASYLSDHSEIFVSNPKEPAFFEDVNIRGVGDWQEYNNVFHGVNDSHKVVVDASTGYLHADNAVTKILEYQSDAKFIVALRNPVEMCISLHGQAIRGDYAYSKDFEESFEYAMLLDGMSNLTPMQKYLQNYIDRCRLGKQCSRLLERVERDKVLFVLFDDLKADPGAVYKSVLNFINVNDDGRDVFPVENAGYLVKYSAINRALAAGGRLKRKLGMHKSVGLASKLQKINSEKGSKLDVPETVKFYMLNFFREDIHVLEQLLLRDLSSWRS